MAKNIADLTSARAKNGTHANHGNHAKGAAKGLKFSRYFTPPGSLAFDLIEWEHRTAAITGERAR